MTGAWSELDGVEPGFPNQAEFDHALSIAHQRASGFFASLDARPPAAPYGAGKPIGLNEAGIGAAAALESLWDRFGESFSGSSGPRYWGYIQGGATPAAIAADWLCSAVDQTGQMHGDSPGVAIEHETVGMLRELFRLPADYHGMFVSGGSMANYVGLAIGLQWLGRKRGIDVSREGVRAIPPTHILTGECHASTPRAAGMLGLGRNAVEQLPLEPGRERVSVDALARRLNEWDGEPVIIVGNAGTVTTGDFDDFEALADLAERHGAFLHADGAFGLFGRVSPVFAGLAKGIERADSIASDAHKWLNVPYDSGFIFSRHLEIQNDMFKNESRYLPQPSPNPLNFPNLGPENSRRLRALPAWATLRAYGREGYRRFVENCCALARELGERLDSEPGFRCSTSVRLNIACFELLDDEGNAAGAAVTPFIEALIRDGRVRVSASMFEGRACVRLAILNWRTTVKDLDVAMSAFRECRGLIAEGRSTA